MILEDFVMLGTTVLEPNKDGRTFVCSAGLSVERRSLVRIYPLSRRDIPNRWNVYRVPVEINPKDNRVESYKVVGDRSLEAHERINGEFELAGHITTSKRADLLRPYFVGSVEEANKRLDQYGRHMSLALLNPHTVELYFDHNPESPDSPELALFDLKPRATAGAKRFPFIPRLRFSDDTRENRLMLRDWGVYERMRREPGFEDWGESRRREHIEGALHLDGSCSLLIGNFNQHRSSWLVISVLRGLRQAQASLLDLGEEVA